MELLYLIIAAVVGWILMLRAYLRERKQKEEALERLAKESRGKQLLVKQMDRIKAEARRPVTTEDRFSPLRRDELLTAFAVGDDEPLLQGVVHVLHAMEIERGDNAGSSELEPAMAKGYAMAQAALKDAQTEILDWVEQANKAKKNKAA